VTLLELSLVPGGPRRRALEDALRAAIRGGRLEAGTRLPSTRALATDLGLARGTIVEAYAQLSAEGYLLPRRGAGTWVADVARTSTDGDGPREEEPVPPARFDFNPGLPDLTAFPRAAWLSSLRRGLRRTASSSFAYGDERGRPELRSALAAYLTRARGVVADPQLIVVCSGFMHGLSVLARVLRAGNAERFAMEDPCLPWHRRLVAAAGLEIEPVPVDEQGARTDLLGVTAAQAAVLSPAHQFPLGALLHPDRRAAALSWARTTGGLVIEDDYDAELRYDRQPVGALQSLGPEHVAYVGTTSKTLAPGLRLGWLLLPPALLDPVVALRHVEDVHVSALDQIAFAELLGSGAFERHIRRMRSVYRSRRDRLVAMLAERAPALTSVGICAGLRMLLELPADGPSAEDIIARAARASIELFPVDWCYHAGRGPRDGIVIGYASIPEHAFESALSALGDVLEAALEGRRAVA
jgi:GntR family transcriptional regulator/MocR family aminotransferase